MTASRRLAKLPLLLIALAVLLAALALAPEVQAQETDGVKPALSVSDPPSANGLTLTLTYDEPLDATSEPAASDFEVLVNGTARTVAGVVVSGSAVTLTLETSLKVGQTVTVSYTPGE